MILNSKFFSNKCHSTGNFNSRSTSILNKNIRFQALHRKSDERGRFIFLKGKLETELITLASIYARNDSQISFLETVFQELVLFSDRLAGDFNYITNYFPRQNILQKEEDQFSDSSTHKTT